MNASIPALRGVAALAGISLAALSLVACTASGPQRSQEWIDPALGSGSGVLRGQKVLVACDAWELSIRQNCEMALFRELQARGAHPVAPQRAVSTATGAELDHQLQAEAASAGARSVMVVAFTPAATGGSYSGASIGIGGFSWGGGGGGGIGLSAPIGGGWGRTGFAAQGRITHAADGRLVWSATYVTQSPGDATGQVRDLTVAVVNAAQGAGLL